ncbi:uncharacterized protein OCT59_008208 [Rhizophagus irregularis]|uniref:uncharacterized protein n=1 Tax=Rhizophagus irregularis TaxID=588596 RepID=UPI003327C2CD|nr:hypothetical protein OCT59_008208 [Rhizophagus irregularis]
MDNTSTFSNICNFDSIEFGMYLCQIHYNQFILNETRNINYNKSCEHPKHDEYKNQSKNTKKKSSKLNLKKVPKRLIEVLELNESSEICSMCRNKTDKDSEYLQNEKYKAPIPIKKNNLNDNDNLQDKSIETIQDELIEAIQDESIEVIQNESIEVIQNESIETKQIKTCQHPKHDEYLNQSKNTSKQFSLQKVPTRLIKVLELDELAMICRNHTYLFRKDILYTGDELQQFESDYQEIMTQLKISTDKDLIGFFDELYAGTNPNTKSETTNNNNKKKLVSLCYFLASINNKYINGIKVDIGSYLETSGASSSSIDTLANIGVSVTRKTMITIIFIGVINQHSLQTHNIYHFVTILLNTNTKIPKIPFYSLNNFSIHNPKGIDSGLIINNIKNNFMNQLVLKDYIECLDYVFKAFERLENIEENYLNNFIIPVIADWRDKFHFIFKQQRNTISNISFLFEMLYHNLFGDKKILSQKPKQTVINLILHLTYHGWKNIRDIVTKRFGNLKDAEYQMMIDLLDNSIPLTLDIYAILFRSGFFEGYLESTVKIWILFQRLRRHNYNKASLMFLSDVFYWTSKNHPIINILKNNLPIFNDYFVENFHSSLRHQTAESNSECQIKELKSLEKKVSLFLFSIFDKIHQNIGNTKQINNDRYPKFYLPSFDIEVDSLDQRLSTSLKENEIPLFEKENNNDDENDEEENIENILERIECDVENQYDIMYQQWLNYNDI